MILRCLAHVHMAGGGVPLHSFEGGRPSALLSHPSSQVWVCLSVQAGQLLLQPGIPDSALSSASAAKVAQYAGGPYQQAMVWERPVHLKHPPPVLACLPTKRLWEAFQC